jgi:hypothetical protein
MPYFFLQAFQEDATLEVHIDKGQVASALIMWPSTQQIGIHFGTRLETRNLSLDYQPKIPVCATFVQEKA